MTASVYYRKVKIQKIEKYLFLFTTQHPHENLVNNEKKLQWECLHFDFEYPDERWIYALTKGNIVLLSIIILYLTKKTLQYITLNLILLLTFFIWVTRWKYMQISYAVVHYLFQEENKWIWIGSWVHTKG